MAKSDPAIGLPEQDPWLEQLNALLEKGRLKSDAASLDKQSVIKQIRKLVLNRCRDFISMGNDAIDRYLNHCRDVLLQDRYPISDSTFPIFEANTEDAMSGHSLRNTWRKFHNDNSAHIIPHYSVPSDMANKALPLMPGEKIRSYDAGDVMGTMPRAYDVVLRAASELIGVKQMDLSEVVELYERRLEQVRLREGRRSFSSLRGRPTTGRRRSRPAEGVS